MTTPIIIWFRRDLRLANHPALQWAMTQRRPIIPLFIWAPQEEEPWRPGAAGQWWLHHSLQSLARSLQAKGSQLVVKRGGSLETLVALQREVGASSIVWTRLYEPAVIARDEKIKDTLKNLGVEAISFNSQLLIEPWEILSQAGTPYKVFTPFYRATSAKWESLLTGISTLTEKIDLQPPTKWPRSLRLQDLELLPKIKWDKTMQISWEPGELGAQKLLKTFITKNLPHYSQQRDFPSVEATSRLSPHLHFGEISPHQILRSLFDHNKKFMNSPTSEHFFREVLWREFSHSILFHFPQTQNEALDSRFENFDWAQNTQGFDAWSHGRTGYPIVDAGMRELWATGWMHNRVRMIVASFLTKDLRLSWKEGARWFWDTLVDASLANNTLGWQWAGGCGADAAPYFRIFNPILQGHKFDAQGVYIRKWIPELATCENEFIHEPWKSRHKFSYPSPILDHKKAREEALRALKKMRS